jgi:hypothetical protein
MTGSLTTVIRRTGLLLILVLGALAVVGSAQGGTGQGVPPQSTIDAASANWAAKAKLLDANGRPVPGVTVSPASGSTRFNWGDFGIGVAAMLGLVLLAMGLLAVTHYRRKRSVRPRPAS